MIENNSKITLQVKWHNNWDESTSESELKLKVKVNSSWN